MELSTFLLEGQICQCVPSLLPDQIVLINYERQLWSRQHFPGWKCLGIIYVTSSGVKSATTILVFCDFKQQMLNVIIIIINVTIIKCSILYAWHLCLQKHCLPKLCNAHCFNKLSIMVIHFIDI
jgi:hypothetical protein